MWTAAVVIASTGGREVQSAFTHPPAFREALAMSSEGSVTRWLAPLQHGDEAAVQRLWERYFARLVGLARHKLRSAPRRFSDEEDVALSAFDSFCRQAEAGRFPRLLDRDSLWRVLVVITARKAFHLIRDENRQKRGGAVQVQTEADQRDARTPLERVLSREPPPELAAEVADECRRLLDALGDKELGQIALWRMEGHSVEEIAGKLGYSPRSVKRKLHLIRDHWEKEVGDE
jgi:DNA-directed RNA polymerase specialized sigma24 family protein